MPPRQPAFALVLVSCLGGSFACRNDLAPRVRELGAAHADSTNTGGANPAPSDNPDPADPTAGTAGGMDAGPVDAPIEPGAGGDHDASTPNSPALDSGMQPALTRDSSVGGMVTTTADAGSKTPPPDEPLADAGSEPTAVADAAVPQTPEVAVPAVVSDGLELALWLDADDAASLTLASGVSRWADRSGNGNDVVQAAAARRPQLVQDSVGGRAAVYFDGADDALETASALGTAGFDAFVVWKSDSALESRQRTILANGHNFELNHDHKSSAGQNAVGTCLGASCPRSGWYTAAFSSPSVTSVPTLWNFTFNVAELQLEARGQAGAAGIDSRPTMAPEASAATLLLGDCPAGDCAWSGYISELLLFSRYLTPQERLDIDTYLATKWDLTAAQ